MYEMQSEIVRRCESTGLQLQVPGSGSPSSQYIIIAEAPGETEVQLKLPLVGNSGRRLWEELNKIGITRDKCYVTNVVKRRLNTNRNNDKEEKIAANELAHWETILRYELSNLSNGKYILLLGGYAAKAVSGYTGVEKWRGSTFPFSIKSGFGTDGRLLITYNPAFILREPSKELAFKHDIQRFGRVVKGTYKEYNIEALINPTKKEALDYIRMLDTTDL